MNIYDFEDTAFGKDETDRLIIEVFKKYPNMHLKAKAISRIMEDEFEYVISSVSIKEHLRRHLGDKIDSIFTAHELKYKLAKIPREH